MEFKYKLIRMNVVKVTNEKDVMERLIAQGFELIEKKKESPLVDINQLTVEKLKELAREKGLEGYSKLSKDELINLLQEK